MFDVKFYCSSKHPRKGYTEAAIGSGGKMVPTSFAHVLEPFVYTSILNCALLKSGKEYHILLRDVEQPEGFKELAVDISGSRIKINLSFSASVENEESVRKLFYAIYFYHKDFSYALYEAYDFCASNDIGYAFDEEKINWLIENCIKKDIETSESHIEDTSERFTATKPEELRRLLAKKLPEKDGVFFAELAISKDSFKDYFSKAQFPWYVFDKQFRRK